MADYYRPKIGLTAEEKAAIEEAFPGEKIPVLARRLLLKAAGVPERDIAGAAAERLAKGREKLGKTRSKKS